MARTGYCEEKLDITEIRPFTRFEGGEIGVGIAIARDPLLGPGRALVSASGSYLG